MIIKMKVGMATTDRTYRPGEIIDWPDDEAIHMIKNDMAERVQSLAGVENASYCGSEKTASRRGRPRKEAVANNGA